MKARTDIVDYPDMIALNYWQLERSGTMKRRRKRMVNTYDNNMRANHMRGTVDSNTGCRVLANAKGKRIIGGRIVVLGDFNLYSR